MPAVSGTRATCELALSEMPVLGCAGDRLQRFM